MSLARAALATDVVFAFWMNPAICRRTFASGASTASESVASWASCLFWRARILMTLSVEPSAGFARRMTAFRSEPRAARPVPSSLRITANRSRIGSW